jgi:integrase
MEQINIKQRESVENSNKAMVIFTNIKGLPYKEYPKKALTNAMTKAGVKEQWGLFHLLRHTAGSLWLQGKTIDGGSRDPLRIELVSEILGHTNISFTKNIYAQFDREDVIGAFGEDMGRFIN